MSETVYKHLIARRKVRLIRRACRGTTALIDYESIPERFRAIIDYKVGDVRKMGQVNELVQYMKPDPAAETFYAEYLLPDGRNLPLEAQKEYITNALVLNAIKRLYHNRRMARKAIGIAMKGTWDTISRALNLLDAAQYAHTLPTNVRRLQDKYHDFIKRGYPSLIHGNWNNQNSRKVTGNIERLICSIYCEDNLPFGTWVHDNYLKFISGALTIVDKETGEVFDREQFFDEKKGHYITISDTTVWNILNDPINALIINKMRDNRIDHITKQTAFSHRHLPYYSLSKVSMDDRTLPRKTTDGKWVNLYYADDVLSGAVIGYSISVNRPDVKMVLDCFRNMYQTIDVNNMLWPAEVDIENHLMRSLESQLTEMFQFVTFNQPGTSRSKRSEHMIRGKKYGDEKRYQVGIGRWNGKGPYKIKSENKDDEYKQVRLPVEQIIQDEIDSINRWNNSLHFNQKLFPGKTRWQVLMENMNQDLSRPSRYKLFRHIGFETATTIRNNDFVQVQYAPYAIDNYDNLKRLKPNNKEVKAYWIPIQDGSIPEVFLYQDETFIGKATKYETFNEAKVEMTDDDRRILLDQQKRQAKQRKMIKDGVERMITKTQVVLQETSFENLVVETANVQPDGPAEQEFMWDENDDKHYLDKALDY